MKHFRIFAELNAIVVGLLFAWITFTGSAKVVGLALIIWLSAVYLINEYTKKDDDEVN